MRACGAEELGGRADRGGLPPLRHGRRTVAAKQDLGSPVADDELYFLPQQKLISKVRDGAKVTKKYDTATTPHRRAERHEAVSAEDKAILADTHADLNPAATQRQIQALTAQLLTLTTSKAGAATKPALTRASADESTKPATRAY